MSPLSIKLSDVEARKLGARVDDIVGRALNSCIVALEMAADERGALTLGLALEAIESVREAHRAAAERMGVEA